MDSKESVAFIATVDVHIYAFHIPFMKMLERMGFEVEVLCANTGFVERVRREGFIVHEIPFSRNPLSLTNLKAFLILKGIIRKKQYRMLHVHTPVAGFLGRLAGRMAGVTCIIYTTHGFHFHEYGSKLRNFLYYRLEKFAGRFTDILITINTDDYKIAKEKNLTPKGKVLYIKGVGVDTGKFCPTEREQELKKTYATSIRFNKDTPILIIIAELIKRKNIVDAIRAVKLLEGKEFKLLIAGNGPLKNELVSLVTDLELNKKVFFLGRRDDVPEILQVSKMLLLTSIHEGLPRAILEAMAMEKPVVAYNIRGVRDLVVDGETGFLVPFGDIRALAEKISFLLDNPIIAEEMGKKGRSRIIGQFDLETVLRQMKEVYEDALSTFQGKGDR